MSRTRGIAAGLLFGGLTLALLFAGQVLTFAAWWLGRAVTGAVILLLAFGVGYAAYELYSGWTATTDAESASTELDVSTDTNEAEHDSAGSTADITDQELEQELEELKTSTETLETETAE